VSELAAAYEVHPTRFHQWRFAQLEGAAGIFERGGQAAATADIAEETVRDLHAKIGDLAVADDFFVTKWSATLAVHGRAALDGEIAR
jgi:transposase